LALHLAALLGCIVGILLSCVVFTNGIEWTGKRLGLHEGATGSILAAIGTALPETVIPVIAFFVPVGDSVIRAERQGVGLGAVFGSPFMLATLAMLVVGVTSIIGARRGRRAREVRPDVGVTCRDMRCFLIVYGLATAIGVVHFFFDRIESLHDFYRAYDVMKVLVATGLILAYGFYLRAGIRAGRKKASDAGGSEGGSEGGSDGGSEGGSECGRDVGRGPGALYASRILGASAGDSPPPRWLCILQSLVGLGGIIVAAHFFVEEIRIVSAEMGVPPVILALIIAPFATELPEMANSLIWTWRGRDALAVGNITGAMVFQTSIPVAIGMLATDWKLDRAAIVSALIALASVALQYAYIRKKGRLSPRLLLVSGSLYLIFLAYVLLLGAAAVPRGG